MKKYLLMMIAALACVACSKDDEGGISEGRFSVQVPSSVTCTTRIPVRFSVACDTAPTITFTTEAGALGIVSIDGFTSIESEKVYAGEPVDVQFADGTATAEFRYIPLSSGEHTVTFAASYTQNGVAKTAISRQVLSVAEDAGKEFVPDVYLEEEECYIFQFRKPETGYEYRVGLGSFEGKTGEHPDYVTIKQDKNRVTMKADTFYRIQWNAMFGYSNSLVVWSWYEDKEYNEEYYRYLISGPISLTLIFRDDCDRCRDMVIKTDSQGKVVSSILGDYYLWRNRK